MKTESGTISKTSKERYLDNCRERYMRRNRQGRSTMSDEVCEVMVWDSKHAINALNSKVSLGNKAKRRGSKPSYGEEESAVIVQI